MRGTVSKIAFYWNFFTLVSSGDPSYGLFIHNSIGIFIPKEEKSLPLIIIITTTNIYFAFPCTKCKIYTMKTFTERYA